MKRKVTCEKLKIEGFYINEIIAGFLGDQDEGKKMLKMMGLPTDVVPFSVATFIQNKRVFWKDSQGNKATISFKKKPNQLECYGTYLKKRRYLRVFLEWSNSENREKIARLESQAIGDLCMRCIYENLITN